MDYLGVEEQPLYCPYCGERVSVLVDCSVEQQEYTEDCQVCCRPMIIQINIEGEEIALWARQESD